MTDAFTERYRFDSQDVCRWPTTPASQIEEGQPRALWIATITLQSAQEGGQPGRHPLGRAPGSSFPPADASLVEAEMSSHLFLGEPEPVSVRLEPPGQSGRRGVRVGAEESEDTRTLAGEGAAAASFPVRHRLCADPQPFGEVALP